MPNDNPPLLHICHAPADHDWVHGRMVYELGLQPHQYRTRADDGLDEIQLAAIADVVESTRNRTPDRSGARPAHHLESGVTADAKPRAPSPREFRSAPTSKR